MIDLDKPYLVIDASSPLLQAGVLQNKAWLSLQTHEGDTLEHLTQLVDGCLKKASLKMESIHGFIFCEGPGSLLGLRLSAMAVNTWKVLAEQKNTSPLLCYKSLQAMGLQLGATRADFAHVISPFRKGFYNHYDIATDRLSLIPAEAVDNLSGAIAFLPQRRLKQTLQQNWQQVAYTIEGLPAVISQENLLSKVTYADAWVPEETEYVRWDQERHR